MTEILSINAAPADLQAMLQAEGKLAVFAPADGGLPAALRRLDKASRGAISRLRGSKAWEKAKPGEALTLAHPAGFRGDALLVVKLAPKATMAEARKAGAALGRAAGPEDMTVLVGAHPRLADIALGLMLRSYKFEAHKTGEKTPPGSVTLMADNPEAAEAALARVRPVAEGIYLTRDLVNEPANVLSTVEFADRLAGLRDAGVEVEVLDEMELEKLGMGALLGVGQGSESPSKVVVMLWKGGKEDDAPLALVGKGVVFDTGGISIKPAAGMEDMTMDMGGAGVVAGVMRTLAARKAQANVVGLVGIVENMPDGKAQRPGDIVRTMKGDTVEVINTDAEGRLVLADVLWYAQDRFSPRGIVDLATLTGAIVIALGHENAGVFTNDDRFADRFLRAARAEGEGAWLMPMGEEYDRKLKSRLADMKNVGGRPAGAVTAAQFLRRFVKDGVPWIHLDIAGVASRSDATDLAPEGATGWGVMALNRMIADMFEG